MHSELDHRVHGLLVDYLAGHSTLSQFRDAFTAATWDSQQGGSVHQSRLAAEVELRLAEFTNGDWQEEELRDRFRSLVHTATPAALD